METGYSFAPIVIWVGWTASQDPEEFIDRFGESAEYFAQAAGEVEEGYYCLDDAVDWAVT